MFLSQCTQIINHLYLTIKEIQIKEKLLIKKIKDQTIEL